MGASKLRAESRTRVKADLDSGAVLNEMREDRF